MPSSLHLLKLIYVKVDVQKGRQGIAALCDQGKFDEALKLYMSKPSPFSMWNSKPLPIFGSHFVCIITVYWFDLFVILSGAAALIKHTRKQQRTDDIAYRIYSALTKCTESAKGSGPDVLLIYVVLQVCIEQRDYKHVNALWEDVKRFRIQPDNMLYSNFMKAAVDIRPTFS